MGSVWKCTFSPLPSALAERQDEGATKISPRSEVLGRRPGREFSTPVIL